MRFLLILVGLIGVVYGAIGVMRFRGGIESETLFALGVMMGGLIFVGLGLATVDIVNVIKERRQP